MDSAEIHLTLANNGAESLPLPVLEVTFTDDRGLIAIRRLVKPEEYAGQGSGTRLALRRRSPVRFAIRFRRQPPRFLHRTRGAPELIARRGTAMAILISGSVAYDSVCSYGGRFDEYCS